MARKPSDLRPSDFTGISDDAKFEQWVAEMTAAQEASKKGNWLFGPAVALMVLRAFVPQLGGLLIPLFFLLGVGGIIVLFISARPHNLAVRRLQKERGISTADIRAALKRQPSARTGSA